MTQTYRRHSRTTQTYMHMCYIRAWKVTDRECVTDRQSALLLYIDLSNTGATECTVLKYYAGGIPHYGVKFVSSIEGYTVLHFAIFIKRGRYWCIARGLHQCACAIR